MPKFVIERTVPGAGDLSQAELRELSAKSNAVLDELPDVQWQHSYVTGDKLYWVYVAPDADSIEEHARRGGFPADTVSEIHQIIDPSTGGR